MKKKKYVLLGFLIVSLLILVTLFVVLSTKKAAEKRKQISAEAPSSETIAEEEDLIPLSESVLEDLEYDDIVADDEFEPYYLYNFLYIGDSFIVRLEKSGIIHESNDVLAKNGTAARDWYVEENNTKYVDFYDRMLSIDPAKYSGIVINYGINDIKNKTNVEYSEKLLDDLQEHFPQTPIFLMKIMPVAEQFVLTKDDKVIADCEEVNRGGERNVEAFNSAMEAYARKNRNVWFVDATKGFVDENGNLMTEKADKRGLHIADEFVVDWCKNIFDEVSKR